MTLEEAKELEMWLLQVWRDSPSKPPYAVMAAVLKLVRNNAR